MTRCHCRQLLFSDCVRLICLQKLLFYLLKLKIMRNNENNIDFFSIPSRTFTRGITICIMISRYERQNDNSFSFLKQELDRIESRPQFFLMYSDPRGWFQIICIKQLNLNLGGK